MDKERTFVRTVELESISKTVSIHQYEEGDVGCVVWDAGLVLAKYLEVESQRRGPGGWPKGLSALELGSGTAVVGITAACLGANVILTDLPEFVPLMQKNILENQKQLLGNAVAKSLVWGSDTDDTADIILVADCIYYEESVAALVETLNLLAAPHTEILLSYEDRYSETKRNVQAEFWSRAEVHFNSNEIPISKHHPDFSSEDIHIVNLHKK